jgi:hypothetical protein
MAETVGAAAAKRATEPDFILGSTGARAKRARKEAAPADGAELEPMPAKIYTSFSIADRHRKALDNHAWERKQLGYTNKFDLSAVLRDALDFWLDHEKEARAWVARRNKTQTRR